VNVELPDGTLVEDVPDGIGREALATKLRANGMTVPDEWMKPAVREVGVLESTLRTAAQAAQPAVRLFDAAAAGLAGLFGDKAGQEQIFRDMDTRQQRMTEQYAPKPDEEFSTAGTVAGAVASLPTAIVGQGVAPGIERAYAVTERGGTLGEAGAAGAVEGALQQALLALPAFLGGKVAERVGGGVVRQAAAGAATGVAVNVPAGIAARAASNEALPEGEQFEDLRQESLGKRELLLDAGLSAALGAVGAGAARRAGSARAKQKAPRADAFPADQMTPAGEGTFIAPNGAEVTPEMWESSSARVRQGWMKPKPAAERTEPTLAPEEAVEPIPAGEATEVDLPVLTDEVVTPEGAPDAQPTDAQPRAAAEEPADAADRVQPVAEEAPRQEAQAEPAQVEEPISVGEAVEGEPAGDVQRDAAFPTLDERLVDAQLRAREREAAAKAPPVDERGRRQVRAELERARDAGEIDRDGAELALWALEKNPNLARGLRLEVDDGPAKGARGSYSSGERIVRIFKGNDHPQTAAHEILHHSERMMPPMIQRGIRREWRRAYDAAVKNAIGLEKQALAEISKAMAGDADAKTRLMQAFRGGILQRDVHYQLFDPSEFWAVNGPRILSERFTGRGSWRAQAKRWLREMVERVKGIVGLRSDAPVLKALDELLDAGKTSGAQRSRSQLAAVSKTSGEFLDVADPERVALPEEKRADELARTWIDSLKPVERAQQTVAPKTEEADMRLAMKLQHGRQADRTARVEKDFVKPLGKALKAAKKAGLSLRDADDYLMALHAPERNRVIAGRNEKMPDGGSGMTNEQAAEIVSSFTPEQRTHLDAIAKLVHDMNRTKLDAMVEDGLISAGTRDALNEQYKAYVPLKNIDDEADFTGIGRGFQTRATDIKTALGRKSKAGSPIANSLMDASRAIARGERARVDKAIWEYAQDADAKDILRPWPEFKPDGDNLWTDEHGNRVTPPPEVMDRRLKKGKVVATINPQKVIEHTVDLVIDGEQVKVFVPDPLLAKTLKTAGDPASVPGWLRAIGNGTRALSRTLTEWNPAFAPVNLPRDTITAAIRAKRLGLDAGAVVAGVPKAMAQIVAAKSGQDNVYRELRAVGGGQGAYGLSNAGDAFSRLEKMGAELGYEGRGSSKPVVLGKKVLTAVGDALSSYNEVFEYATRLSAYRNGLAKGMTPKQAAAAARDITIDFNVSGEAGRAMGHAYMFANAALQGTVGDLRDIRSPKTRARILSLVGLGIATQVANEMYGGENDETGDPNIAAQSDSTLDSNITLLKPGSREGVKIPLPPGIATGLYALGRRAARFALHGDTEKEALGVLSVAAQSVLPVRLAEGENVVSNALQGAMPAIVRPFADVMVGTNQFGARIVPEKFDKNPPPSFTTARSNTSGIAKAVSKAMNDMTGGDDVTPGRSQKYLGDFVSPEAIEHLVGAYTGGTGQLALQSKNIAARATEGKPPEVEKTPVVRRFVAVEPKSYTSRRYKELQEGFEYARDYQKKGAPEKIEPKVARALPEYESAERELRGLFTELRRAGPKPEAREPIEARIKQVQSRVIRAYNGQPAN
jgi:hypothetical protein